jgi:protein-tyrosine phosphatase
MFNKILIVCVGNICRSPVGEALFKQHYTSRDKIIDSAGLEALVDEPASPFSIEVMDKMGIDIRPHRAQQLTETMAKEYELILVMEQSHQKEIEMRYPFARGKIFRLGHWRNQNIPDPYQQPKTAFDKMAQDVRLCVTDWIQKID